jgi:tetratricopeptide (TPR) repeat protein
MGWRRRLASAHKLMGHVLVDQGHPEEALHSLTRAAAVLETTVGWDPTNARWKEQLASVLSLRSYVLGFTDDPGDQERSDLLRTLELAQELRALDPADPAARSRVLLVRTNLAALDREVDHAAATRALREVLDERDAMVAEHPSDVEAAGIASRTWALYASWRQEDGATDDAIDAYERAVRALDGVENREENPQKWHGDRVRVWLPLAEVLASAGRDEAGAVFDRALASMTALALERVRVVDREALWPLTRRLAEQLGRSLPFDLPE